MGLVDRYAAKVLQPHVTIRGKKRPGLSKTTLAHHLALLKTMLNYAVDRGWLRHVLRIKKPKVRMFSTDYAYLRTQQEIERVLRAAREVAVPGPNDQPSTVAAKQGAKFFELRTTLRLARIWQKRGQIAEIRQRVEPLVGWFTEGCDMPDIKEAKALLAGL